LQVFVVFARKEISGIVSGQYIKDTNRYFLRSYFKWIEKLLGIKPDRDMWIIRRGLSSQSDTICIPVLRGSIMRVRSGRGLPIAASIRVRALSRSNLDRWCCGRDGRRGSS
jgi:hypothetical protein